MRKIHIKYNELVWDEWNTKHISKHGVRTFEIEEALEERVRVKKGYKGRIVLFGKTRSKRLLAIIVKKTNKGYYVFSARNASRKERRYI